MDIIYTLAPKIPDKEIYTYEEISQPWRRMVREGRKMVRLPTLGVGRTVGFCGTTHFNPDMLAMMPDQLEAYETDKTIGSGIQRLQEVASYVSDTVACTMVDIAQEWTKTCEVFNKDKNVCALGWGDAAHRDKTKFNGHKTHGYGDCIDLRPIRKGNLNDWYRKNSNLPNVNVFLRRGAFKTWPISHTDDFYDRDLTRKLLHLLKEKGGENIVFFDPGMEGDSKSKKEKMPAYKSHDSHRSHIHVCFKENKANRERCKNFRYDRAICGPPIY